MHRSPVHLYQLTDDAKAETKISLRYLTHGLSWAPSYRIDITDPKSLALEQHAVIRNELTAIDGAEVRLISGYPSVQFAHVRSLLAPVVPAFSSRPSADVSLYLDFNGHVEPQWGSDKNVTTPATPFGHSTCPWTARSTATT